MKKCIIAILLYACFPVLYAQTSHTERNEESMSQYTVLKTVIEEEEVAENHHQVISNRLKDNWFVLGEVGLNTYWSDYTSKSSLGARMTPQFNFGAGKWFLPGYGAKVQLTGFGSRADKWHKGNFTGNDVLTDADGNSYWKERIKWVNLNVDFMLNLSRLIKGYEGNETSDLMNQFIASFGIGATLPQFPPDVHGTVNSWAGHIELQYSRFFSEKKNLSLDVRLRGMIHESQFDGVCEQFFDENISLNVGVSYYFKNRGWENTVAKTTYYVEDQSTINQLMAQIDSLMNRPVEQVVVVAAAEPDLLTYPYLVNFVIDKVKVVNRERVNLKVVAEMMKATPNQKYLICGYADKYTGSVKRNIWLAENRAKNVFTVLTEEFEVPADQLVLDDKGGVDNMFYDDPQLSRSVLITRYEE